MNIKIIIDKNKILLEYKPRYGIGWLEDIFYNDETTYKIKRLFEVSDTDFCSEEPYLPNDDVYCAYAQQSYRMITDQASYNINEKLDKSFKKFGKINL